MSDQSKVPSRSLEGPFPDAAAVFDWKPTPLQRLVDSCLVILDTNVLAVPYTVSPRSLEDIAAVYRNLRDAKRLRMPGQVAREFAGVREKKLGELSQQLHDRSSQLKSFKRAEYPLLGNLSAYQEMLILEDEINEKAKLYRKALSLVQGVVSGWSWDDPVSSLYADVFSSSVVDPKFDNDDIAADAERRKRASLPPGYKDNGKADGGYGDLIIWRTLLEIGRTESADVLFVTEERKADWWHGGSGNPRYELIDEFRRASGGHTLTMTSLSALLDLFGVGTEVVEEVASVAVHAPAQPPRAVQIFDQQLVSVRSDMGYGVVKPLRQTGSNDGASIDYEWWYQSDGTGRFEGPGLQQGRGEASERYPGPSPRVRIGPLSLEWSVCGNGSGWLYFDAGPAGKTYDIAQTPFADISNIGDASNLPYRSGPA